MTKEQLEIGQYIIDEIECLELDLKTIVEAKHLIINKDVKIDEVLEPLIRKSITDNIRYRIENLMEKFIAL